MKSYDVIDYDVQQCQCLFVIRVMSVSYEAFVKNKLKLAKLKLKTKLAKLKI